MVSRSHHGFDTWIVVGKCGADVFITVTLGDYVKVHKIETLYAGGGGSKAHTAAREGALKSGVLARRFTAV